MYTHYYCYALTLVFVAFPLPWADGAERVEFNRDIRPILSEKCFACHGPDEAGREAELRLDVADDAEGPFRSRDGSQAIKPGDVGASQVWYRLTTDNEDEAMPPRDSDTEPLTAEQLELMRKWIRQGAEYEDFWAFVTPKPQPLPVVQHVGWCRNRIDRFVMSRLEQEGLTPQPRADKRALIRRVTFDLTGLPPTRDEVRQFLADDSQGAYERLVNRLICSPRYGEHMAKYWLDLVRFADTNGIHHDHYREMTPYRDWVIRAFNANLAFDAFIVDQIAGDLYDRPTLDQQIASGFNRLHLVIDRGTAIPKESFTRNVIDRVTAVGTAFMGLTVGCAVCHDHKYDPVTQRDFYQLYAFFNNIDADPETPGQGIHAPFIRLPNSQQRQRLKSIDDNIAIASAKLQSLKGDLRQQEQNVENRHELDTVSDVGSAKEPAATLELKSTEAELESLQKAKRELESVIPVSLVMKERPEIRPTHILVRGVYDQPGEKVERDTPAFLPPLKSTGAVKTRMDLARWLTDQDHPLTARVTVNRFWQQFFGAGLVKTSEDFGTRGELPSHPELLDELTDSFVRSGWDVKRLVRSIVCSETYQQSSRAEAEDFTSDPDNRMLARGSRFRLDAEMIRDQVLAVCGSFNDSLYGKSVKPPQPPDLWKNVSMVSSSTYSFTADEGAKIHRRSLYSFWKRALPPPQMTIFDAPTRESCTARRERTNTPLQALVLMNEEQYFRAAQRFARTLLSEKNLSCGQRLSYVYESITSRLPDDAELVSLRNGLDALRQTYQEQPDLAKAMTSDVNDVSDQQRIEIAAFTMLVNSLFNLDVAKTRE